MSDPWNTPYGADYNQWQEDAHAWAANWGAQATPQLTSQQTWWGSDFGYNPVYGASYQYAPRMGTDTSDPYRPLSTYTSDIIGQLSETEQRRAHPELFVPPQVAGSEDAAPMASPKGGDWDAVNKWDPYIQQYLVQVASETGVKVPGNVVKALMMIESRGGANAYNPGSGATGPLQVTANTLGNGAENGWSYDQARADPNYALYAGIKELALRFLDAQKTNLSYDWSNVANGYFSGSYEFTGNSDGNMTDNEYTNQFNALRGRLDAMTTPQAGQGGYNAPAGTKEYNAIWGGGQQPVTQEFGPTAFAASHAQDWYKYAEGYGLPPGSHPGVDVGVKDGTRLYTPVAGKVIFAGGTNYYQDDRFLAQPKTGEFMIQLANGDQLILGHMSHIDVNEGDTIAAGTLVGTSGYANGAHVHVEYRTTDPSLPMGQRILDPRMALAGNFSGQFVGEKAPGQGGVVTPSATNWQDYLRAAASGQPLVIGKDARLPTGTFQDYLLQVMGIITGTSAQQQKQMPGDYTGGKLSNAGGSWELLDQQNGNIASAVERVYKETGIQVPANLVKGVLAREGGFGANWNPGGLNMSTRPGEMIQGWSGITRSAARSWRLDWNMVANSKAYNTYAMAYIMAQLYKQDSAYGWEGAMTHYLTGSPTNTADPEGQTQTQDYLYGPNGVINHWHNLDLLATGKAPTQEVAG
jgi:murein DD-endopeptidase MepM/ murein hydrolase activator NlpD